MFELSASIICGDTLARELSDDRAGAFVLFEGRVRNHNQGKTVDSLEYEAYEALAVAEGNKIIGEAVEKFSIYSAVCVHRTGHLVIGDVAVWVGVISAHREASFAACKYIIDEVKHRVPIWKREHYTDGGAEWVSCEHSHDAESVVADDVGATLASPAG